MKQIRSKKRPCRICRKWFKPDPRLGNRQKTCGADECKRQWHIKKCAEWNKKNQQYFREIYLAGKLSGLKPTESKPFTLPAPKLISSDLPDLSKPVLAPKPRLNLGLPRPEVQEVIGAQALVIIEYIAQVILRRFQEVIPAQLSEIIRDQAQLPPMVFSRGDRQNQGP